MGPNILCTYDNMIHRFLVNTLKFLVYGVDYPSAFFRAWDRHRLHYPPPQHMHIMTYETYLLMAFIAVTVIKMTPFSCWKLFKVFYQRTIVFYKEIDM